MRRDKKKKLARTFTIVTAVLLLLIFIVRDVLRENWKDVHDSLAQAEAQFRAYARQSAIARRSQDQTVEKILGPQVAGTGVTPSLVMTAVQALQQAYDDFLNVSDLIDALPPGARDLRKLPKEYEGITCKMLDSHPKTADLRNLRDECRVLLDAMKEPIESSRGPEPPVPAGSANSLLGEAIAIDQELDMLGQAASFSARHVLQAMERRIRICSYAIYALGSVLLVLGIYAAIAGLKSEGTEA